MSIRIEKVKAANGSELIKLQSPYHPNLPARAKALGGRFNGEDKSWYFDPRDEERVRTLVRKIFGTDGSSEATDLVTLRVSFPAGWREDRDGVFVAGRCIARAFGRDSGARLGEGVILLAGSIDSGGSRARWKTAVAAGSVFEVRDVPRAAAEAAVAAQSSSIQVEIIEAASTTAPAADVEALRAERERLLARIAEIDAILASA